MEKINKEKIQKDQFNKDGRRKSSGIKRKRRKVVPQICCSSDEEIQSDENSEKSERTNNSERANSDRETEKEGRKRSAPTNTYSAPSSSRIHVNSIENSQDVEVLCDTQNIMECDSTMESMYTILACHTLIIGVHSYSPEGGVVISQSGVKLRVPHLEDKTNIVPIELKLEDIALVLPYYGTKISTLFFYTSMKTEKLIRVALGGKESRKSSFAPQSRNHIQRPITLVHDEITEESKLVLKNLFTPTKLLSKMDRRNAARLLLLISPIKVWLRIKELMKKEEEIETLEELLKVDVKSPVKKAQHSRKIPEQTKSSFNNTENVRIEKKIFKQPMISLRGSTELSLKVKNSIADSNSKTRGQSSKKPIITNRCSDVSSSGIEVNYTENIEGTEELYDIQNVTKCDNSIESMHTVLTCRTVMIGSYNYGLREEVIVSRREMRWKAPHLEDKSNMVLIELQSENIVRVNTYWGKKVSVLFFYAKLEAGTFIRDILGMKDPNKPYYKPLSTNHTQRLITLILDEITEESRLVLKDILGPKKLFPNLIPKDCRNLLHLVTPRKLWLQINDLMKQEVASFEEMLAADVILPVTKTQHSVKRLEQTKSTFHNSRNIKIEKTLLKQPIILLKKCDEVASPVQNPIDDSSQTLFIYPSLVAKGGITVTAQDYACLKKDRFLNDIIIDFYLKYLTLELLSPRDRDSTYIFSIHFYKRLTSTHSRVTATKTDCTEASKRHANVRKWTKDVNIFEKDFIIVPIHKDDHWFLAIICFPDLVGKDGSDSTATEPYDENDIQYNIHNKRNKMKRQNVIAQNHSRIKKLPCILVFDSLVASSYEINSVTATLRDYLSCEHQDKLGIKKFFTESNMKGSAPKVPLQTNFSDCGLYVLQYVESFFLDPIEDYTLPIMGLQYWFDESRVTRKRSELSNLLQKLAHPKKTEKLCYQL